MRAVAWGALTALVTGCSFINSFDSVKPSATGGSGPDSGSGGTTASGGKTSTSGGTTASGGKTSSTGGTSDGGPDASSGGTTTGGTGGTTGGTGGKGTGGTPPTDGGTPDSGGPFTSGGPNGAIVAYDSNSSKLYVLSPTDGTPLSSEPIGNVPAIVQDPATDIWYIFEQGADLSKPSRLHVRELNTTSGKWKEIGLAPTLPTPQYGVGVLNQRLAYLSSAAPPASEKITMLDTSLPRLVKLLADPDPLPGGNPQDILFTPSSSVGGTLNVVMIGDGTACPIGTSGGTECSVYLQKYSVTTSAVTKDATALTALGTVSGTSGTPGDVHDPKQNVDVLVFPPADAMTPAPQCIDTVTTMGTVQKFSPITHVPSTTAVTFPFGSPRVNPRAAYDPCNDVVFVTTLLDYAGVYAIPLGAGGTAAKFCTGAGSSLLYEPYTRALFRIPAGVGGGLENYTIGGTKLAPTLDQNSLGGLPSNLSISAIAVRQPSSYSCQ
ncbi:MAG TPA: hypothetical protein VH142_17620 [Polyangiaceae bacterium]|nr:hypothetical protein [Polyangiaceae bacterium]